MMPTRKIVLGTKAKKYYQALDKTTRRRILEKLESIAADPFHLGLAKPIFDEGLMRTRVGGYRVLYEVKSDAIIVSAIGSRGQIYKNL